MHVSHKLSGINNPSCDNANMRILPSPCKLRCYWTEVHEILNTRREINGGVNNTMIDVAALATVVE